MEMAEKMLYLVIKGNLKKSKNGNVGKYTLKKVKKKKSK